jgi:sugar/nucleoside kinase (ribokinase family)
VTFTLYFSLFTFRPSAVPPAYLALGHLAKDLTPDGSRLGGTVAYAALTAQALGYPAGIVTAHANDVALAPLADIALAHLPSPHSTTFENIYSPEGRTQFVRARAVALSFGAIPTNWRGAPILHVAPLVDEIEASLITTWPDSFIGLTPQGWLREWDAAGRVRRRKWAEAASTLPYVSATVISIEDIGGDWAIAEQWAKVARVLVVTEGAAGCTVFVRGEGARQFAAPPETEVDPTGAGDIFAAAFFIHLYETTDPWAAARFANQMAALSVTRPGLEGVPTLDEVSLCRVKANSNSQLQISNSQFEI